MMWNEFLLIVLFSLGAGFVTSCGYFALFMTVGVISRIVQFTHTAGRERFYENLVITAVLLSHSQYQSFFLNLSQVCFGEFSLQ